MNARTRWWTFGIVCAALFMAMLDNLVVLTALPTIRQALHATVADLEWTVNAYTLTFAALMLTGSTLGDRFGRKRIFLLGVALFTAGSAAGALSDTASHLLVARTLQGLGAAFLTPLTLTMLVRVFPPEQRTAAIGLWSGVSGLGLAVGPLVGGAIVNGGAWHAIFWVNVPVGLGVIALGWLRLEESFGDRQPLDVAGLGLAGAGLFAVTFGLIRGNTLGWSSPTIVGAFVAGIILLAAFVLRERTAVAPMLNLHLFSRRQFSVPNAVVFLMSAGMFGSIFLLTLFIQQIQGASPLNAGLKTVAWTGTVVAIAPIAGVLGNRIGARPLIFLGMAVQMLALLWFGTIAQPSTPYLAILPAFILGGLGMGLTFPLLSSSTIDAVPGNLEGQASGAYNSIRELGGVFGVAILGAVFQHVASVPTSTAFMAGFRDAVLAGAAVLAVGTALTVLLPAARREPVAQRESLTAAA